MHFDKFVERMERIQKAYRAAKSTGDRQLIHEALRPLDETQAFWFVPTSDIWLVDYQTVGGQDTTRFAPSVRSFSVEDVTVHDQTERSAVGRNFLLRTGSRLFSNNVKSNVRPRVTDGLYDTRKAYLTMSEGNLVSLFRR